MNSYKTYIYLALLTLLGCKGNDGNEPQALTPQIRYEFSGGAGHYNYAPSIIEDQYGIRYGFVCENRDPFKIVDYVFLILIVMSVLGIPTTSLITAVGTAGVAIGLALKDSLSNFASGVLLLANAPFKDGDFVDIGGQSGVVTQIGLMNTTLKTLDNRHIVVPNNTVAKSTIINYSTEKLRRLDLNFAILGKGDPQVAIDLIQSVLEEEKDRILEEPEKPLPNKAAAIIV